MGLGLLLFWAAFLRNHVSSQRELCGALESAFESPFEDATHQRLM